MPRDEQVEVVIEVPRGSFLKRELRGEGLAVDYVSPLPSPFNYGCIPGSTGDDGDPLDVVVLGSRLPALSRVTVPVVGIVRFVDAGLRDDKIVASVDSPSAWQRRNLARFFALYACARTALNAVKGVRGATRFEGIEWS